MTGMNYTTSTVEDGTFLGLVHFEGFPPAAEFSSFRGAPYRLNESSLRVRIANLKKDGRDTIQDEIALRALETENTP